MSRETTYYDDQSKGGGSRGDNFAKDLAIRGAGGAGAMAGLYQIGKADSEMNKLGNERREREQREAESEMQRETRGVKKPANFDAMQESIQEAKDAAARKKISGMGYSKGGSVGSASKRADGIATKGKTKGTMVKMNYGGKC
jgi:hypothetical protein